MRSTCIFFCIMTMVFNFTIFFILKCLFSIFFYKYRLLHFHMILAALVVITFFVFKINYFHCVLSEEFTKFFHAIFTSVYIMLIFYASNWRYCRHWKTWLNMFPYFRCGLIFRNIFTSINLFFYTLRIYINNKCCFIRCLIYTKF